MGNNKNHFTYKMYKLTIFLIVSATILSAYHTSSATVTKTVVSKPEVVSTVTTEETIVVQPVVTVFVEKVTVIKTEYIQSERAERVAMKAVKHLFKLHKAKAHIKKSVKAKLIKRLMR